MAGPVAPGKRGCWVSLEPTLSKSVKKTKLPKGVQSNYTTKQLSRDQGDFKSTFLQKLSESESTLLKITQFLEKIVLSLHRNVRNKAKVKHQNVQFFADLFSSSMNLHFLETFGGCLLILLWQPFCSPGSQLLKQLICFCACAADAWMRLAYLT